MTKLRLGIAVVVVAAVLASARPASADHYNTSYSERLQRYSEKLQMYSRAVPEMQQSAPKWLRNTRDFVGALNDTAAITPGWQPVVIATTVATLGLEWPYQAFTTFASFTQ